jgi:ABC-type transport system substrate-binding protein
VYLPGTDRVSVAFVQILQANYQDVGVTMNINFEEGAANTARQSRGDFTLHTVDNWGTRPDPSQYLGTLYLSTSSYYLYKPGNINDPEVDRLILGALAESDFSKRYAMYRDLAVRLNDTAWGMWFHAGSDFKGLTKRVKGFVHQNDHLTRYKELWLE